MSDRPAGTRSQLVEPPTFALIAAAGVVGAALRAGLGELGTQAARTSAQLGPELALVLVNSLGCLLLGLIHGSDPRRGRPGASGRAGGGAGSLTEATTTPTAGRTRMLRVALAAGFCGALTTFSAVCADVASRMDDGAWAAAALVLTANGACALGCYRLGLRLATTVRPSRTADAGGLTRAKTTNQAAAKTTNNETTRNKTTRNDSDSQERR